MSYNGTDASTCTSVIPDFNGTSSFSISAWVDPNQIATGHNVRLVDRDQTYALIFDAKGNLQFQVNYLTPSALSGPQSPLNQWNLVTAVYDDLIHQMRLYVNGVLVSAVSTTGTRATSTNAFCLGSSNANERYNG